MSRNLKYGDKIYKINLWDTAGQEKYHSLTKIFLNEAKIAFIVYSIDDINSYKKVDFWYDLVKESCGDVLIALIGNKKDLYEQEEVNEEEAIQKAKSLNVEFGLTSALEEDTGFDEIIDKMVKKYVQKIGGSIENEVFKNTNIKLDENQLKEAEKNENALSGMWNGRRGRYADSGAAGAGRGQAGLPGQNECHRPAGREDRNGTFREVRDHRNAYAGHRERH